MNINKKLLETFLVKLFKIAIIGAIFLFLVFLAKKIEIHQKILNMTGYLFGELCILIGVWKLLHSEPKTERRFYSALFIVFGCIWGGLSIHGIYSPFPTLGSLFVGVIISIWLAFFIVMFFFIRYFNEETQKNKEKMINISVFLLFLIFICLYTIYFIKV